MSLSIRTLLADYLWISLFLVMFLATGQVHADDLDGFQKGGSPVLVDSKQTPVSCVGNLVLDSSFEGGGGSEFWDGFSFNTSTPLCTTAVCGLGGGTGPRSGDWWLWFVGYTGVEEGGALEQFVTIPVATAATLEFYLEIPRIGTEGYFDIWIDDTLLRRFTQADQPSFLTYQLVSLDITQFADGFEHLLYFESLTTAGLGPTSFFVDDVCLTVDSAAPVNDLCSAATVIAEGVMVTGSSEGATGSDITACANGDVFDVWHSFTPSTGGIKSVSLEGSAFDTTLAIFDSCSGTLLACNDDFFGTQSQVEFSAVAGV